ncbi:MAG TPA: glycoside hydrolase family 140 protein [Bacteroidales bacterium]|nr:glycoside hydrolase family 140 protein [Bacteroidales bacterium]
MKKPASLLLVFLISIGGLFAQPLKVTKNERFLQTKGGADFFWQGDTGWELFHRLNRDEAAFYLKNRADKGFNVVQAVILYELEAYETPNDYGDWPLVDHNVLAPDTTAGNNPANPEEYDYWDHVEYVIREAKKDGLIMGILPCWGEYVTPRFRERDIRTPDEGYKYGHFVGSRFRDLNDDIVWILGGDRLPDERENGVATWRAMAEGITDGVNGEDNFDGKADYTSTFMTYHCYASSARWFSKDPWIDMYTWGSYHEKHDNERAYDMAYNDWNRCNPKPTLNSEPAYELSPVNYDAENAAYGWFDDFDVRQVAYWSVFSGTCGHTYGCGPVWQMYKKKNPHPPLTKLNPVEWRDALDEPGAFQLQYLKKLILSRPFESRKPDQEILAENVYDPTGRLAACSGKGYAMVYIPTGKPVSIETANLGPEMKKIRAWWYNPKNGEATLISVFKNKGETMAFDAPGDTARGNDWVLVLDDASSGFSSPGN